MRVAEAAPLDPWPKCDPLAVAAIAYTSGTTGNPKGGDAQPAQCPVAGGGGRGRGSYDADDVFLCVHPLTILNLQVLHGLTTIQALAVCAIADRHDPLSLARWIKQERVTHFAVVPTVAYDLLTHPEVHPDDLSTLTKPRVGGAAMPESVKLLFEERFGTKPATSLGITEGPTLVTRQDPDRPIIEGSCGQALPHIDVQVLDDDDRPVEGGEVGRSASDPDATARGPGCTGRCWAIGAVPSCRRRHCEAGWSTPATWAASTPTASCSSWSAAAK